MPRAFCPECAAEVPVDDEGRCFLGHQVPATSASGSSRPDVQDAVDEPEPWVASVTSEGAEAPDDEAVDDATAAAGRATPAEEAMPTSTDDAGTPRAGEVPDPPAEGEEVELDLDTLEQAVAEMGLTAEQDAEGDEDAFAAFEDEPSAQPGPEPEGPEVEVHEDAVADVLETQDSTPRPAETEPAPEAEPEPAPEPEPEPTPEPAVERQPEPEPQPEPDETPDEPDEWAAFDAPAEPEAAEEEPAAEEGPGDEPEESEEPEDEEPVDTANFLARPKGKRRGLFGR